MSWAICLGKGGYVAVSVRQTCSQLLCSCLACITDGENMPLMKSHNKKASPEVLDPRETKQEATCLPTVPTVLWPALCPKRDLSKWLFQQYCWTDVMSHCSWKRTISILFLPIPHEPTHSGTCMSMFWVNFLCQTEGKLIQHQQQKQQKPTLFFAGFCCTKFSEQQLSIILGYFLVPVLWPTCSLSIQSCAKLLWFGV